MLFDRLTVYEYAYNGKVLGYVQEQEVVTDVLGIVGKKLSSNNSSNLFSTLAFGVLKVYNIYYGET